MISALLVLGLWSTIASLNKQTRKNVGQDTHAFLWGLDFTIAISVAYLAWYTQINLLPNLGWNRTAVIIEAIAGTYLLTRNIISNNFYAYLILPFREESKATKIVCLLGFGILAIFTFLTSSPLNWDSNAYNIARIATMLSEQTTLLTPSTASARQAIYSVGHDLLFYPDITLGILRGLPAICVSELYILAGVLLGIKNKLSDDLRLNLTRLDQLRLKKIAGFIAIMLLFGSHQQVMQSVITKNDLAITMLFCISASFGCVAVTNSKQDNRDGYLPSMAPQLLTISLAASMKSYGLALIIPVAITLAICFHQNSSRGLISRTLKGGYNKSVLIIAIVLFLNLQFQAISSEMIWKAENFRITPVTSAWTNMHGSVGTRLGNALKNSQRIFIQGILFPYTATKPYSPLGAEINSPLPPEIVPEGLRGKQGSATGDFMLLYGTNPDMAYPLLFTQWGLILGITLIAIKRPLARSNIVILLGFSSISYFALISFVLLYQHFISRFLGPSYIILIPLASVSLGWLTGKIVSQIKLSTGYRRISYSYVLLSCVAILPLLSSISMTGYISRRAGMPQGASDFYEQYLWDQRGLSKEESAEFVRYLKDESSRQRIFCSHDGAWTLTPMVTSQSNKQEVKLLNEKHCSELLIEKNHTSKLGEAEIVHIGNSEFINLP